ncbi:acyltransferase family protein [Gordonia sp. KTR9]|uniref:acyltransferase family protein n=1 Tax=Gordonia sp. KTR9 TaxID=337191 RepID=UPI00027DDCB7|nr:acyltransferase [Gordonia sp. KTR9]AFR47707.1 putative membrane protein [Gordonia sp. KTR9]
MILGVQKQRFEWMDALRGIAMLLVVVLHSGLALNYYADSYPRVIEIFNLALQPFRMPMLMFLSGMLLNFSLSKPAGVYFDGKARKILWPYAVWTLIALAAQGDLTGYTVARAVYDPVETHLWYLWFLLIFYTVAWIIRPVPFWIPALIALAASHFLTADFRLEKMAFLFAFFVLGKIYSDHASRLSGYNRPSVLVGVFVIGAIASGFSVAHWKVLYEPLYFIPVVCGLFLALCIAPRIPQSRLRDGLTYLGRESIVLYVVHLIAIKSAGTLLSQHGVVNPWLLFPALLVIGVGTSIGFMMMRHRFKPIGWLFEFPSRHRVTIRASGRAPSRGPKALD